jgi:hypothetical protein
MDIDNQDQLVRILQTAISPVVLISGVGLLVLSITQRFARTTERARALAHQRSELDAEQLARINLQIRILYRRSKILLVSTSLALTSELLAALLIVAIFAHFTVPINLRYSIVLLFVMSLISLVLSLAFFIKDMTISLRALKEELREHL